MKRLLARYLAAFDRFFTAPASARPLAAMRIGVALILLAQAYLVRGTMLDFLARDGLVQGQLADYLGIPGTPKLSWVVQALAPWGLAESAVIQAACWTYVATLALLALGLFTRPVSVAAWLLHWTLASTGCTSTYGVDVYAHVFLFYLMWAPAGDALSLDVLLGLRSPAPRWDARLVLRVVQLHLCITYFCSAIDKASGPQWWDGEVLWRALTLPEYRQFDFAWLARMPWIPKLAGWATLLFEGGYWVFIWPRPTRRLWVAAMAGLHLGIAVFLGLGVFGSLMCVLTVAAFGFSAEPAPVTRGWVLIDGACNLCNGFVRFVAPRDPAGRFRFASLQSEEGRRMLARHGFAAGEARTVVLIEEGGTARVRSDAVLSICRGLSGAWPALGALAALPRPLRDAAYDYVARRRYRWFGQSEQCALLK